MSERKTETSPLLPKAPQQQQAPRSVAKTKSQSKTTGWQQQQQQQQQELRQRGGASGRGNRKSSFNSDSNSDSNSNSHSDNSDIEQDRYNDHYYDGEDGDDGNRGRHDAEADYRAGFLSPVHTHRRRQPPLSYVSDSSATPAALGGKTAFARKPRWAGFRSKVASLATKMATPSPSLKNNLSSDQQLPARLKTRRSRFRSSDYDEAIAARSQQYRYTRAQQQQSQPPVDSPKGRVAAYCTCDQISVLKLLKWLEKTVKETPPPPPSLQSSDKKPRFHLAGWQNKMYMGVVHSFYQPPPATTAPATASTAETNTAALLLQRKDAFYFATGCCVFWGFTREEEAFHIQSLTSFSSSLVSQIQAEDMEFTYGDHSRVANDAIVLSSQKVEEKLAISFAMTQSAKLDVFEDRVELRIQNTKHIPFNLATTGSIQYSQHDISKLIGQLFMELADVNLHSDILDEPDFLWEDDEYEPLYKKMMKYLDVQNRVKILNKRLEILRELVEVLNQELGQQHGTKLEWIIIWLLVVEVVISIGWNMIVKDLLGFFNTKK